MELNWKLIAAVIAIIAVVLVFPFLMKKKDRDIRDVTVGEIMDASEQITSDLRTATGAANESAAIGALRTVSAAQASFQSAAIADVDADGVGEYGTLAQLGASNNIDSALASGRKNGYVFTITLPKYPESAYACNADPESGSGLHFFVDETGVITFNESRTATAADEPK